MDLNEKLAQRRKEREQKSIADRRHLASVKKLENPINFNKIFLVSSILIFGLIMILNFIEDGKIKSQVKSAFDDYGVFLGSKYGNVRLVNENNACMVFCEKDNCQVANFVKIRNEAWVVKNVDSSKNAC